MSEIISFVIYRTEKLIFDEEQFTVSFTKRNDGEEYALFAVNDAATKSWRAFYSAETAADFHASTGRQLEIEVYQVLKGDLQRGHVESHPSA